MSDRTKDIPVGIGEDPALGLLELQVRETLRGPTQLLEPLVTWTIRLLRHLAGAMHLFLGLTATMLLLGRPRRMGTTWATPEPNDPLEWGRVSAKSPARLREIGLQMTNEWALVPRFTTPLFGLPTLVVMNTTTRVRGLAARACLHGTQGALTGRVAENDLL